MVETKNEWKAVQGQVRVRRGTRAPWLEIVVTKKNGKKVKLIAKTVDSFHSERGTELV